MRLAGRKEFDQGREQDRDMIGGQAVAEAVVFFSDLVCNVNLGGSLWEQPQLPCRSGPPGGGTTARGGCPRQATAHIYLPNHGNVAREMQEKGDHRLAGRVECGCRERPRRRDLALMIHIGHL